MPFSLLSMSGYTPTHGSSNEYCSICRYYREGWCKILLRRVASGGWCRLFRR